MIGVVGSLRNETYETENGKRSKSYVLAENVMFLQAKKNNEYPNVVTKETPEEINIDVNALPF